MSKPILSIKNLHAKIENVEILKGLNLTIYPGETHAIMGPNGSGKSTLSKVLAGHPAYEVTQGEILFEVNFKEKNLLSMEPHERAREGLFLAYQYPVEIPGINNFTMLHSTYNAVCKHQGAEELDAQQFRKFVKQKLPLAGLDESLLERGVNSGFSGGEKKKNELLQMAVLSPRLSIMDETDSGLDIDALKIVADGINKLKSKNNALLLITHYQRLLNLVVPDYVHVFAHGKIVQTGDRTLALELEKAGYQ